MSVLTSLHGMQCGCDVTLWLHHQLNLMWDIICSQLHRATKFDACLSICMWCISNGMLCHTATNNDLNSCLHHTNAGQQSSNVAWEASRGVDCGILMHCNNGETGKFWMFSMAVHAHVLVCCNFHSAEQQRETQTWFVHLMSQNQQEKVAGVWCDVILHMQLGSNGLTACCGWEQDHCMSECD